MNKRKQLKIRGAGESGVAKGPETEVLRGCQMDEKAVSCRGCVWGRVGNNAVCGIRPRHPIFFIIDRVVVRKGLCTLSLFLSLSCVCACAHVLAPMMRVTCVH